MIMKEKDKTKEQLMHELAESRRRMADLETSQAVHMQREEASRKSEEALWGLINATKETLILIDREGTVLLANEVVAKRLDTSAAELIGSCLYDHLPPEITRFRKEQHNKVILTGKPVHYEDAREGRFFETYCYPVFDKEGEVSCVAIFAQEITKRKQVEKELLESEERYRLISENMMDVICLHYPDSRYVYVSPSLETVLGYSPEEALGKSPYDFLEPEDCNQILTPSHKKVAHEKVPDITLYKTRRKDGSYIWLETKVKPVLAADGTLRYILSASRDVTEHKQAEERLQESEKKYRSVIQNIQDVFYRSDARGNLLMGSPSGAKMFGYNSVDEMIGLPLDLFWPDPEERRQLLDQIKTTGSAKDFEAVLKKKDGTTFNAYFTTHFYYDDQGNFLGTEGIIRDVTERKRSEEEKARLESQLLQSRKMEAIGTLAGGIAHDFNNILSAIMGYTNLLQMKMSKDDPLYSYLKHIFLSTEKAASLTQSLLTFSRKQFINPRPLNLNETISKVAKLLSRLITEDIELKIVLQPKNLIVMADSGQIDQIILNLVTNARDAMPNGGTLTINTKKVHLGTQFKSIHGFGATGNYAAISIADTGAGIDAKTREKIFEPFFTTKEVGKGTGLGLSIVYGIVQQHNGFVDVSSKPHHGTTFVVYLPLTEKKMEKKPDLPGDITGGTETILLAEDNAELRTLTKTVLENNGYTVIEAVDGSEAVTKFLEHVPDFIILDVVMPKKNGKEVYDEISRKSPDIKILFTSGYTDDIIYQKGIMEEGLNFISKPFSPYELLHTIRRILNRK
jgi:PAS domain S-box-containing protein